MKYLLYIILISVTFSCKKKKCEQETLPDITVSPTYENLIYGDLVINIKNSSKDSAFKFGAVTTWKYNGVASNSNYSNFKTINYNGYTNNNNQNPFSSIYSSNCLGLANNSIWQLTSSLVGNINHTDDRLSPVCNNASTLALNTISLSNGININLTNFTNADVLIIDGSSETGGAFIYEYDLTGINTITQSITSPLSNFYLNDNATITLTFVKKKTETINGVKTIFEKRTTYKYLAKVVA
jgi:hypothetical protein